MILLSSTNKDRFSSSQILSNDWSEMVVRLCWRISLFILLHERSKHTGTVFIFTTFRVFLQIKWDLERLYVTSIYILPWCIFVREYQSYCCSREMLTISSNTLSITHEIGTFEWKTLEHTNTPTQVRLVHGPCFIAYVLRKQQLQTRKCRILLSYPQVCFTIGNELGFGVNLKRFCTPDRKRTSRDAT